MSLPQPPPEATYIFRGHAAQIHSTQFIRGNTRLVTGDAEGWIVVWGLASRRSTAVWRAHKAAILGVAEWGSDRLITHGKDNKLIVWKFSEEDEASLSATLPVEDPMTPRKQPWLLYVLDVNSLNFCSFGHCIAKQLPGPISTETTPSPNQDELLIAVPNTMSSEAVDIFHLPSQKRLITVPGDKATNTGMVMSVAILYVSSRLTLVVGYESGHTMVVQDNPVIGWCRLYLAQPHSQPILSLGVTLNMASYITSGADGIIAKHPLSSLSPPLAQPVQPQPGPTPQKVPVKNPSLLSGMFAQYPSTPSAKPPKPPVKPEVVTKPLKVVQTKHSGQQSLRIRSDGRIFATAGWDTKVRVYSVASMKELAVLKWHKDGCFAVAFAEVINVQEDKEGADEGKLEGGKPDAESLEGGETAMTAPSRRVGLAVSAKEKRIQQATQTHWVAAGSKDGKVSLWEIY
ncbi:ASTRA complex subunit [Pseudogymnoascus destructans]|uniref:ASTRA-associated protein 1 n=2 Tax=Pseudogymnoascus destructans TaxID=655981 RepID=L8GCM3_PSED2|nr:ASTRA complex subunit [Pseudogymnoascus destructans]ELR09811.1 hypothetical protein GMDG_04294 [Pseudogymnoascus destructans 20631-21]OAF56438.1 ASTRA complex subunit [Pseudogymnoascus destructans]